MSPAARAEFGARPPDELRPETVVAYPEPSPGAVVARRDVPGNEPVARGGRLSARWDFGCERCDHRLRIAAPHHDAAIGAARLNGWVINGKTLCPSCATIQEITATTADESDK